MNLINCDACDNLQENAYEFVTKGVTDKVAASLKNDTGFNPDLTVTHHNCEDLNDANDCLIGRMIDEVESYESCDWKKFTKPFIQNLYNVLKAMIASMCGLWISVWWLYRRLTVVSYVGILRLQRTTGLIHELPSDPNAYQVLPFNYSVRQGNVPASVLSVSSDYTGIDVNNTLDVPILVEPRLNVSVRTDQPLACCYIVVYRGNQTVGQTPFITPTTYDQQVVGESFILNPNETASLRYYFRMGASNAWFLSQFGGTGAVLCLDENTGSGANQKSYFEVKVSSIVDNA